MKMKNPFKKRKQPKLVDCTEVYCTLQVEGTHSWPDCPFEEVNYLRVTHRHVFHIKAYKRVYHDDRDVEFIMLKHDISNYIINKYGNVKEDRTTGTHTSTYRRYTLCEFGAMSCEMIAKELCDEFRLSRCEVSEDGENGAIMTRECTFE